MKPSTEARDRREDAIAIVAPAAPAAPPPQAIASPGATRLLSLLALAALLAALLVAARGAYYAVADAWVAPMHLSPESREVVAVRMQAAKENEQRASLESDLTSATAEIGAIDLSLGRLRTLEDGYANASRWNTGERGSRLASLTEEKALLDSQRAMTVEALERDRAALERAKREVEAGVITAAELQAAQETLARTQLARSEKELEYVRVSASLEEEWREAAALTAAAARPAAGARGARLASPDVLRLDEVRINVELQLARLGAERRAAEARQRAARASIESMDHLRAELEMTPLFLAARHDIDLAFVPYAHLEGVRAGDAVYSCRWFLIGCRDAGRIRSIFPGEVVTDDPWGSVARGQYVELEMSDRSAMAERTLRVRHGGIGP